MAGAGCDCQAGPEVAPRRAARDNPPMARQTESREERLAAALRDNLRRRKAQARAGQDKKDPAQPASE